MNLNNLPIDPNDIVSNIDQQQMQQLKEQLDEDAVIELWQNVHETQVQPHLADIKQRTGEKDDIDTVLEKLKAAPAEKQQQAFDSAMQDIIEVFLLFRENPVDAVQKGKRLLRDPYTVGGLLMIFEHDEHIDSAYSAELQQYTANVLQMAGVALIPEAYTREERQAVIDQLPDDALPDEGDLPES